MARALITLFISLVGAELTALTFAASLEPDAGIETIFLPAVFPIASIGALVAGLLAWPAVFIALPSRDKTAFVLALYGLTMLGTVLSVRFVGASFVGPIAAFMFSVVFLTLARVLYSVSRKPSALPPASER